MKTVYMNLENTKAEIHSKTNQNKIIIDLKEQLPIRISIPDLSKKYKKEIWNTKHKF